MGEETAKTLLAFHTSIHHVYDGDTVGGIRIVAQRPED